MHSSRTPSNQSHTLDLGDCIGMESCVDLNGDLDILEGCCIQENCVSSSKPYHQQFSVVMKKGRKEKKEYPPPLAHLPWVMKRYYTSDGRLIINEEKVERHEYFEAHRSNGRLTLNLVPFNDIVLDHDDDADDNSNNTDDILADFYEKTDEFHAEEENNILVDFCEKTEESHAEEVVEEEDDDDDDKEDFEIKGFDDGKDRTVEDESKKKLIEFGGLGICHTYDTSSRGSNSSMFSLAVPAIRPVHT